MISESTLSPDEDFSTRWKHRDRCLSDNRETNDKRNPFIDTNRVEEQYLS